MSKARRPAPDVPAARDRSFTGRARWVVPAVALSVALPLLLALLAFNRQHTGQGHLQDRPPDRLSNLSNPPPDPGQAEQRPVAHERSGHAATATGPPALVRPQAMPMMPGMAADGVEEDTHAGTDTLGLGDAPAAVANLGVLDQVSDGRTMTVGVAEVDGTPGWVVVQQEVNRAPGPVVGMTRRLNGQAGDATTVRFSAPVRSGAYWVSLHRDLGRQRVYEFPGPDQIVVAAGSGLQRRVVITVR